MKNKLKSLLISFYFGAISEHDRLLVERELLDDPETLLDYFELKRGIEAAEPVPVFPSDLVWQRLNQSVLTRKKILKPLFFGAGLAACLAIIFLFVFSPLEVKEVTLEQDGILFDSSSEHPVSSNVL